MRAYPDSSSASTRGRGWRLIEERQRQHQHRFQPLLHLKAQTRRPRPPAVCPWSIDQTLGVWLDFYVCEGGGEPLDSPFELEDVAVDVGALADPDDMLVAVEEDEVVVAGADDWAPDLGVTTANRVEAELKIAHTTGDSGRILKRPVPLLQHSLLLFGRQQ